MLVFTHQLNGGGGMKRMEAAASWTETQGEGLQAYKPQRALAEETD